MKTELKPFNAVFYIVYAVLAATAAYGWMKGMDDHAGYVLVGVIGMVAVLFLRALGPLFRSYVKAYKRRPVIVGGITVVVGIWPVLLMVFLVGGVDAVTYTVFSAPFIVAGWLIMLPLLFVAGKVSKFMGRVVGSFRLREPSFSKSSSFERVAFTGDLVDIDAWHL